MSFKLSVEVSTNYRLSLDQGKSPETPDVGSKITIRSIFSVLFIREQKCKKYSLLSKCDEEIVNLLFLKIHKKKHIKYQNSRQSI